MLFQVNLTKDKFKINSLVKNEEFVYENCRLYLRSKNLFLYKIIDIDYSYNSPVWFQVLCDCEVFELFVGNDEEEMRDYLSLMDLTDSYRGYYEYIFKEKVNNSYMFEPTHIDEGEMRRRNLCRYELMLRDKFQKLIHGS